MKTEEAIGVCIVVTVTFVEAVCLVLYVDWLGGYGSVPSRQPFVLFDDWLLLVLTAALALGGFLQVWATRAGVRTQRELVEHAAQTRHDQWRAGLLSVAWSSVRRIATYADPVPIEPTDPEVLKQSKIAEAEEMRRLCAKMEDATAAAAIVASEGLAKQVTEISNSALKYAGTWSSASIGQAVDLTAARKELADELSALFFEVREALGIDDYESGNQALAKLSPKLSLSGQKTT